MSVISVIHIGYFHTRQKPHVAVVAVKPEKGKVIKNCNPLPMKCLGHPVSQAGYLW